MLRVPVPLLAFKVYPESRKGWYLWAVVYRTSRQLETAHKMLKPNRRDHKVWGFVSDQRILKSKEVGSVRFCLYSCTDNTVAHEFFHAAILWAEASCKIYLQSIGDRNSPQHERVAEAHGNMVSQFWREFSRHYQRKECWGWGE